MANPMKSPWDDLDSPFSTEALDFPDGGWFASPENNMGNLAAIADSSRRRPNIQMQPSSSAKDPSSTQGARLLSRHDLLMMLSRLIERLDKLEKKQNEMETAVGKVVVWTLNVDSTLQSEERTAVPIAGEDEWHMGERQEQPNS